MFFELYTKYDCTVMKHIDAGIDIYISFQSYKDWHWPPVDVKLDVKQWSSNPQNGACSGLLYCHKTPATIVTEMCEHNLITVVRNQGIFFFVGNCQLGKAYQGDCSDASSQEEGEKKWNSFTTNFLSFFLCVE